jgi:hypothetical protein
VDVVEEDALLLVYGEVPLAAGAMSPAMFTEGFFASRKNFRTPSM